MAKLSVIKKEFQIFWKNNPTITLDILYIKEKEILSGYISKINSTSQKKNNSLNDFKRINKKMALFCS